MEVSKERLCYIIYIVFHAEDIVNENEPELRDKLRDRKVTPQEYVEKIADEIISNMK